MASFLFRLPGTAGPGLRVSRACAREAQASATRWQHLPQPQLLWLSCRELAVRARDPERPKRPATPWLRYLQNYRQQKPELKHSEVMKTAAGEWKLLSVVQRVPFVQPYEAEKKTYDAAFKQYTESGKLDAWKRDPEKPKRPETAFMLFLKGFREKNASLKMTEQAKLGGEAWKSMSAQEKAPYEQKAGPAKEQYKEAMDKYKASGKEAAWKEKVGLDKADAKKAKEEEKKQKEKAKLAKQKEREAAKKQKEKEKLAKQKEVAKKKQEKEKEKLAKQKDTEKSAKDKVAAKQPLKQAPPPPPAH